ncbi:sulfatase [Maribellus maritimus]|uniref:sulfatase n=1 Tax=Maribellus maritimus TaxID=2870838 RepID=UPI001EEA61CF|nr:sulfatase [Maribellus maritimus]MCG6188618.1 sulfatase [Maribellus maritimus]
MKKILLTFLAIVVGLQIKAQQEKYNVLMISVDDMNDWAGFLKGYPYPKTPAIDKLAGEGVRFNNAHCAAPLCNPSRSAVLTGMRPGTTGLYNNKYNFNDVLGDVVTLPRYFKNNGYYVAGAGKLFHADYISINDWDEYLLRNRDNIDSNIQKNRVGKAMWAAIDQGDEALDDTKMVDYVIHQLKQEHNKPFFLHCGTYKPHLPWYIPKKYFDMHPLDSIVLPNVNENDFDDIPQMGKEMIKHSGKTWGRLKESGKWKEAVQAYLAAQSYADAQIGRLLKALENSKYAGNTIVLLWGDHGWHLGEKLHWSKNTLWEEATRAPLVIKVPGNISNGRVINEAVDFMNIYPTLADFCGLEIPKHCEGFSMKELMGNPDMSIKQPAITTCGQNNHAMRDEKWRYIHYNDGTEELYDHEKDPMEWTNLANDLRYNNIKSFFKQYLPTQNKEQVEIENYHDGYVRKRGVVVSVGNPEGIPLDEYYKN